MIASLTKTVGSAIAMTTNNKEIRMNNIDIQDPGKQLIRIIEESCGLNAYKATLDLKQIGTAEYQKNYVSYYRVRRDEHWLAEYFSYMQKQVGNPKVTFEKILRKISNVPHRIKNGIGATIEASFASKMLATLDQNCPIWDRRVAKVVGVRYDQLRELKDYVKVYDKLTEKVNAFRQTDAGSKCIEEFNRTFPDFVDINPVKKIDLYLWKMGK